MRVPVSHKDKKAHVSTFRPSDAERDLIRRVQTEYQDSYQQLNKRREVFNNRNVFEVQRDAERDFNNYIPEPSLDPEMSWRAQTSRPVTRNKVLSIHGSLLARIIVPQVIAQNEDDEEDQAAAETMRTLLEYVLDDSRYVKQYVNSVFSSLVAPAAILYVGYSEVTRKVRYKTLDGEKIEQEIVDQERSGPEIKHINVSDFYIGNIWEADVQRQPYLVVRRHIDKSEAQALYGDHKNWNSIRPGTYTMIPSDGTHDFIDYEDALLQDKYYEELTYHNKTDDLEVVLLNGVPVTDVDEPNPRLDKKYPFVVSGGEPLTSTPFFYYKSIASKLGPEKELVDTLHNMILDGTFLELMPPMAYYGKEELDGASSIHVPGSMVYMGADKESGFDRITPQSNIRLGAQIMENVERSLSESSQSPLAAGNTVPGERTAVEARALQQNAQLQLGYSMRMLTFLAEDVGTLLISDILQHMTVGEVSELTDGPDRMKYSKYFLPADSDKGREESKTVVFNPRIGDIKTEDELLEYQFELLEKEGYDSNTRIYMASPELLMRNKYLSRVTAQDLKNENEEVKKALKLEGYDRMIQNPTLNQEEVTKEFLLKPYVKNDVDRFMMQKEDPAGAEGGAPSQPQQDSGGSVVSQINSKQQDVQAL